MDTRCTLKNQLIGAGREALSFTHVDCFHSLQNIHFSMISLVLFSPNSLNASSDVVSPLLFISAKKPISVWIVLETSFEHHSKTINVVHSVNDYSMDQ